jgi:UDP-glucose 4-epimerase
MRLLVTGGAGTLGSEFIRHYVSDDSIEAIHVLDNLATGSLDNLPESDKVSVTLGSVDDKHSVRQAFEVSQPDTVLHAAASYADPQDWEQDVSTNTLGTIDVIRASHEASVKRLVNLQTVLCYGRPDHLPIEESHPLRPTGSYAITKVAAEQFALESGISVASLRIGSVLSHGLAIGPVPAFYKRLSQGESCTVVSSVRDFLDPVDFHPLLRMSLDPDAPQGVFNVSSGEGHSMMEVYELVAAHLRVDLPVRVLPIPDDDVAEIVLNPTKALESFGWKATRPFAATVAATLGWYDTHGVGSVRSHRRVLADD